MVIKTTSTNELKVCLRTEEEIKNKIKELCENDENFTFDNSSSDDDFQIYFSSSNSETTMNNFVKWLFKK